LLVVCVSTDTRAPRASHPGLDPHRSSDLKKLEIAIPSLNKDQVRRRMLEALPAQRW
jgi:hypothetical protein